MFFSSSTLWYNHMCLLIWTVFSGKRCGPWVSCFLGVFFFGFVFFLSLVFPSLLVMHFWSAMLLQRALSSSDANQSPLLMKWYPLPVQYLDFFISVWWSFGVLVVKVSSISVAHPSFLKHLLRMSLKSWSRLMRNVMNTRPNNFSLSFFKLHPVYVYVCASWFDETCTTPKVFSHFFWLAIFNVHFTYLLHIVLWPCNVIE